MKNCCSWPAAIAAALLVWLLTGCVPWLPKPFPSHSKPVDATNAAVVMPPLPPGVQKPLAVSRAAPAVVGPPAPHIIAVPVPQTFSDMMGTNLWHPFIYVQTSTNLIDWQTVRTVPLEETPATIYLTNSSQFGAFRTGW